jgi:two-component system cell cycle response regulator
MSRRSRRVGPAEGQGGTVTAQRPPEATDAVLVVDDSAPVRTLVASRLRAAGYDVVEAKDGAEALARYSERAVPVVVTDITMPRVDGLALLERLRHMEQPPEVILLTATRAEDASAAIQALRLGAHDYLAKDDAGGDAVVLAVRRAAEQCRLRAENAALVAELRRRSLSDSLTRVGNRRAFDEALTQEVARARRAGSALSLALVDIDHFKEVNDLFGHIAGDGALAAVAGRLTAALRSSDRVFRYGGEEFVVLLGDTELRGAVLLAERVVAAVSGKPFVLGDARHRITCSVGVAVLVETDDPTGLGLVARADAALYEAKRAGRNRAQAATGRSRPGARARRDGGLARGRPPTPPPRRGGPGPRRGRPGRAAPQRRRR